MTETATEDYDDIIKRATGDAQTSPEPEAAPEAVSPVADAPVADTAQATPDEVAGAIAAELEEGLRTGELSEEDVFAIQEELALIAQQNHAAAAWEADNEATAAVSAALAHLERLTPALGPIDHIAAWQKAEEMLDDVKAEFGFTDGALERMSPEAVRSFGSRVAQIALTRAAKQLTGRESYNDIIERHAARARRVAK